MKLLDRYIIGKFLGTYLFSILLFTAIAVVIDFTEKVDDFLDSSASAWQIISEYYLNFIPWIVLLLSPLFIFISVIYFTSKLAYKSEIIAILNSGMSFYRLLFVPYFLAAALLVGFQLYSNHYLVPQSNARRINFEDVHLKRKSKDLTQNVHIQIDANNYVSANTFSMRDSSATHFVLETFTPEDRVSMLYAKKARYREGKWWLEKYYHRRINGEEESLRRGKKMDTIINVKPSEFTDLVHLKEAMSTPELNTFIDRERLKGSNNISFFEMEKHRRSAMPFATFFLTIIGMSIGSRKVRGGTGFHLFFGIALSAAYVVCFQFSSTFSTLGDLPTIWGAWIPNILFGVLAIVLMFKAQK